MGDIRIMFDQNDEVAFWKGNPIYLDALIKEGKYINLLTINNYNKNKLKDRFLL